MFQAMITPIFRSTRLCVTACGRWPATSSVHYITSCNTQSSALEDGRDHRPKHVELIGIINKPLLLHLVSVYFICFNYYKLFFEHYKSNYKFYFIFFFTKCLTRCARLCVRTVTQTQATIQTVTSDYLSFTIPEFSLTYVADSVQEPLL